MNAPVREPDDDGLSKDGPLNYAPKRTRQMERHPDTGRAGIAGEKGAAADTPRKSDTVDASAKGRSGKGAAAAAAGKSAAARKGDAASVSTKNDTAPQRGASELPEPPWKRKNPRQAFAGDIALAELRTRLPLTPDRLPDPPLPASSFPKFGRVGRLAGIIVVATVGVVGYRWGSAPSATQPQRHLTLSLNQAELAPEQSVSAANLRTSNADAEPQSGRPAASDLALGTTAEQVRGATTRSPTAKAIVPQPSEQMSRDSGSEHAVSQLLTVAATRLQQADEPARLTISTADAGAGVVAVIGGLAPGSALSAGTQAGPNTWRLSTEDFNNAVITPPSGFIGIMDLTVELRLADNTAVDRKKLQLEWSGQGAAASAKSRQLDANDIALMRKNGAEFMANGNIVAARMMFQPAAEAGDSAAAFALAETYDPLVLRKLGAKGGVTADVALAHSWYEKAKDLGSTVAPERLERLARLPE